MPLKWFIMWPTILILCSKWSYNSWYPLREIINNFTLWGLYHLVLQGALLVWQISANFILQGWLSDILHYFELLTINRILSVGNFCQRCPLEVRQMAKATYTSCGICWALGNCLRFKLMEWNYFFLVPSLSHLTPVVYVSRLQLKIFCRNCLKLRHLEWNTICPANI